MDIIKKIKRRAVVLTLSLALAASSIVSFDNAIYKNDNILYAYDKFDISTRLDMSELQGFAASYSDGLDTTMGGGSAEPVIVTTMAQFKNAVSGTTPRVVVVSGQIISMSSGTKKGGGYAIDIGSNKTIVGMDDNAELYGGINLKGSSNVIISNLNIHGVWPYTGPSDTINIDSSHHIWLNHLNVWNSKDGNLDIKTGADYITVSWCKFWYEDVVCEWETTESTTDKNVTYKQGETAYAKNHGHRLSCLIGSGAGDHDDTDMGKFHITYHHNWFADYVNERMPRVMYGRAHVYNNYYTCSNNLYCIGADSYASVLIENNYFSNVKNPHQFSYPNGAFPASIVARGNKYDNTSGKKDNGQKIAASPVKVFETTTYNYNLNNADDIPEVVKQYAGTNSTSKVPDKYKNSTVVKGVEDKDVIHDTSSPLPTQKPVNSTNDNPVKYDKSTDTYTYSGQNSDKSNAYYTIENPFKNKDFSENLKLTGGYPKWTKGVTISYWVNVPANATDAVVLNFNLENDRQMQRDDAFKYNLCQNYNENDKTYSLGTKKIYVDANGKEYTVLSGYGKNVQYNPNYPSRGYYATTNEGSAIYAYEKGKDSSNKSNWTYLSYIGQGYFKDYAYKFDETYGGKYSKVQEGYISGSFSLYASGTMGYRQDNWKSLQINPNLDNYGITLDAHQFNQFYYWGNGSDKTLNNSTKKTPVMEKKGNWHFVVVTIQNDYVTFFMDGIEMTTDYINYWGQSLTSNINAAGKGFNLGYGNKINYRTDKPSEGYSTDMLLLDFISDEDTTLTVGGLGAGAENLGQNTIGTPSGTQIKNLNFYDYVVEPQCIKSDSIDLSLLSTVPEPVETKTPAPPSTAKPTLPPETTKPPVTETTTPPASETTTTPPATETTPPSDNILLGDVDKNNKIDLLDAQIVLKMAVGIIIENDESIIKAADVNLDKKVDLKDAVIVLKMAVGIPITTSKQYLKYGGNNNEYFGSYSRIMVHRNWRL